MEFAIVDIETTGGHAAGHGITEVSIHIHDGIRTVRRYDSLINPGCDIPYFITGLTGITNEMVADAPSFSEVAGDIFELLQGRVFVAHSVNFDYSFIKHALADCGYELDCKKLCTVRLSRKLLPGFPSYSLGNLCTRLGIQIHGRHRAGGDAAATVKLLEHLIQVDSAKTILKFLKRGSKEQALPPHLPKEQFEQLPETPGVYYFYNQKGKVIYVGKAVNIKKRVLSHFSNNSAAKQKADFVRHIHRISHTECGNELMAFILESHEIKRLWPEFNRAQKHFEAAYGIIEYSDQRGFRRLAIEKVRKGRTFLATVSTLGEGHSLLRHHIEQQELCIRLCGLATDETLCRENNCECQSHDPHIINSYNDKIALTIAALTARESFVIVEKGRSESEVGCVWVHNGQLERMGFVPSTELNGTLPAPDRLEQLPPYRENFTIRQLISNYRHSFPERVVVMQE
jgi:DNA polymerase-3 subunit epsilon